MKMETKEERDRKEIFDNSKVGDVINFKHDGKGVVFYKSHFIVRVQIEGRPHTSFITRHKIILN